MALLADAARHGLDLADLIDVAAKRGIHVNG